MDVKPSSLKVKNKTRFIVKGINNSYANTIRRLITAETPVIAIDDVEIISNDSALYDEILAHRLGLVPFTTDLKSYVLKEDCKCKGEGCAQCTLKMTLKKSGPCNVYASDIKTQDPKIKPVFPKMLLTKLLDGQNLEFIAIARLGLGKEHAKFVPGLCFYQGYPIFKIEKGKFENDACAKVCPKKILVVKGKNLSVTDEEKCDLCGACRACCPNFIQVQGSDEDFIFTIEPWGQLDEKEMITAAIESFDEKLKILNNSIKDLK